VSVWLRIWLFCSSKYHYVSSSYTNIFEREGYPRHAVLRTKTFMSKTSLKLVLCSPLRGEAELSQ
jgi:hypothetical protein